jgi:hypothetical protein
VDLARSGRPAAVNYRVVYRWFVCWRMCPLPLSATYAQESAGEPGERTSQEMVVLPNEM